MKLKFLFFCCICAIVSSCGKDLELENNVVIDVNLSLESKIIGTSWKLTQNIYIDGDNVEYRNHASGIGSIIYFSPDIFGTEHGFTITSANALYVDNIKSGYWWTDKSKIFVEWVTGSATLNGKYSSMFGLFPGLKSISDTEMVLEMKYDTGEIQRWIYTKVDNTTSNPGTGGPSYEAPDVYYYDSTPGYTTLKVQFKIGNQGRTKINAAKGYCGSKTVNGNIGSSIITFNFTNLQRGTQYKVSCNISGPGGSCTTEAITLSTLD